MADVSQLDSDQEEQRSQEGSSGAQKPEVEEAESEDVFDLDVDTGEFDADESTLQKVDSAASTFSNSFVDPSTLSESEAEDSPADDKDSEYSVQAGEDEVSDEEIEATAVPEQGSASEPVSSDEDDDGESYGRRESRPLRKKLRPLRSSKQSTSHTNGRHHYGGSYRDPSAGSEESDAGGNLQSRRKATQSVERHARAARNRGNIQPHHPLFANYFCALTYVMLNVVTPVGTKPVDNNSIAAAEQSSGTFWESVGAGTLGSLFGGVLAVGVVYAANKAWKYSRFGNGQLIIVKFTNYSGRLINVSLRSFKRLRTYDKFAVGINGFNDTVERALDYKPGRFDFVAVYPHPVYPHSRLYSAEVEINNTNANFCFQSSKIPSGYEIDILRNGDLICTFAQAQLIPLPQL